MIRNPALLIVLIAAAGAIAAANYLSPPAPPPQSAPASAPAPLTDAEKQTEAAFQRDVATARRLRASLANPKAFELTDAIRMPDGTLCLTYRAQNAFGAIVINQAAAWGQNLQTTASPGFDAVWNARCAGKTGENVRHIRQAL